MHIKLRGSDSNWVPNRPDGLRQDVETVYLELTSHAPGESVPHVGSSFSLLAAGGGMLLFLKAGEEETVLSLQ